MLAAQPPKSKLTLDDILKDLKDYINPNIPRQAIFSVVGEKAAIAANHKIYFIGRDKIHMEEVAAGLARIAGQDISVHHDPVKGISVVEIGKAIFDTLVAQLNQPAKYKTDEPAITFDDAIKDLENKNCLIPATEEARSTAQVLQVNYNIPTPIDKKPTFLESIGTYTVPPGHDIVVPRDTPPVVKPFPGIGTELLSFVKMLRYTGGILKKADGITDDYRVDFTKSGDIALTTIAEHLKTLTGRAMALLKDKDKLKKLNQTELLHLCHELDTYKTFFGKEETKPRKFLKELDRETPATKEAQGKLLTNLTQSIASIKELTKPTFSLTMFATSTEPPANDYNFNAALTLQLKGVEISKEMLLDLKQGLELFAKDNPIEMKIKFDEKAGLQMQIPAQQSSMQGKKPKEVLLEKERAAIHLICMMFANLPNGGTLVIGGGESELVAFTVAFANMIAEKINDMLSDKDKRKIEMQDPKPTAEKLASLKQIVEEVTQGMTIDIHGKTMDLSNTAGWKVFVPDITREKRDTEINEAITYASLKK